MQRTFLNRKGGSQNVSSALFIGRAHFSFFTLIVPEIGYVCAFALVAILRVKFYTETLSFNKN